MERRQCTGPQTSPFPLHPLRSQHAGCFAVSLASSLGQRDPPRTTDVGVGVANDTVGHLPPPDDVVAEALVEDGTRVVGGEVAVPISENGIVFTTILCPGAY